VPYDKSVGIVTNRVKGAFSALDAALMLMEDTELRLAISKTGQLTIKTVNESKGIETILATRAISGTPALAVPLTFPISPPKV